MGDYINKNNEKLLVCITPQSNSRRLIKFAGSMSVKREMELHILHVEKGDNIFKTDDSTMLLQELFNYGSELGGTVHGLCADDVFDTIVSFIKSRQISVVVLGEPPISMTIPAEPANVPDSLMKRLKTTAPLVEILELKREDH